VRKGKCPKCGAGPQEIEIWTTLHGTGERKTWLKCSDCYQRFDPPKSVKKIVPMSDILAAVDVLEKHLKWRRGGDGATSPTIVNVSEAIDTVVKYFKEKGKL
jgi:hypothetical protein